MVIKKLYIKTVVGTAAIMLKTTVIISSQSGAGLQSW
jgi:hypothetical protein